MASQRAEGWQIPPRLALTAIAHYRRVMAVDENVNRWIASQMTDEVLLRRMHPEIKKYEGGYQSRLTLRAIRLKTYGLWAIAGAGKTMVNLEVARLVGPTLIIVPPTIFQNAYIGTKESPGDLRRYYGGHFRDGGGNPIRLRVVSVMGDDRSAEKRKGSFRRLADIYFVSPYILGALVQELKALPIAQVIVDESDEFGSGDSVKTGALMELRDIVDRRMNSCANPSPTSPIELYWQMQFLVPGLLGKSELDFCQRFGEKARWGWEFKDDEAKAEILRIIRPYVSMVTEDEIWPNRPPLKFYPIPVPLGPSCQAQYDSMKENARLIGDEKEDEGSDTSMAQRAKLQEIAAGFAYVNGKAVRFDDNRKLNVLAWLVKKYFRRPDGRCEQFVVWVEFEECYEMLLRALTRIGVSAAVKCGNDKASMAAMRAFTSKKITALIAHPKSLSHGVRLHNARNMVWFNITQSARRWYQGIRRIWRKPRPPNIECRVFMLLGKGTVDEEIYAKLESAQAWRTLQENVWRGR